MLVGHSRKSFMHKIAARAAPTAIFHDRRVAEAVRAASTSCACTTSRRTPRRIAAGRTRPDVMTERERGAATAWRRRRAALHHDRSRIEMCWPCRVVEDSDELVALFIAAGSPYKAGPKRTAQAKRTAPRLDMPPDEYVWRNDTLRLMLPGQWHSVSLSWSSGAGQRRLLKYFVNLEEPCRRTDTGFDTQDHTLDVEITPDLAWRWRDEAELENHVTEAFIPRHWPWPHAPKANESSMQF